MRCAEDIKAAKGKDKSAIAWLHVQKLLMLGGSKLKTATKPLPLLCNAPDQPVSSAAELADVFITHFASIEKAILVSHEDAQASYDQHASTRVLPTNLSIGNVMSMRDTIQSLHKVKKRKAGPDLMSNDLLALAHVDSARHMHPLLAKTQLTAAEPSFSQEWHCSSASKRRKETHLI